MTNTELGVAVAAIVAALVVGVILSKLARTLLGRQTTHPALVEMARPTGLLLFWLSAATGILIAVATTSPATLEPLPTDLLQWLPNALVAGLFLILGYTAAVTVAAGIARSATEASGRRQRTLERAVRTVVFAGAVVLALGQLGVETAILNILVGATALGVAAAFAGVTIIGSRPIAANIAAGRALVGLIAVGEQVVVGPPLDLTGVVVEIGNTHTSLTTATGRTMVPNELLCSTTVSVTDG